MATPKVVPRADGEGGIGTASLRWGESHFDALKVLTAKVTGIEHINRGYEDIVASLSSIGSIIEYN